MKEDKEILDFIKELIDEESNEKDDIKIDGESGWHGNRSWWIEICLAFIISGLLFLFGSSLIMIFDFGSFTVLYIVYFIILFFIQAIIILAIIVVIEYFLLFKFLK